MARTLTPPGVWTAIVAATPQMIQVYSGPVQISKSASPTSGDYISLGSGYTLQIASGAWVRGSNDLSAIVTYDVA